MGSYSDYLENVALDKIWGSGDPASLFVALFTVMPDEADAGGTEVVGTAYARLEIVNNSTNFPGAASSMTSLAVAHQFAEAGSNWGTVVGAGIYDALTGGNLLAIDEFPVPIAVPNGSTVSIPIGGAIITQD